MKPTKYTNGVGHVCATCSRPVSEPHQSWCRFTGWMHERPVTAEQMHCKTSSASAGCWSQATPEALSPGLTQSLAAAALPPGWKAYSPGAYCQQIYHRCGATVFFIDGAWRSIRADEIAGTAPTRDEAMAKALGWTGGGYAWFHWMLPNEYSFVSKVVKEGDELWYAYRVLDGHSDTLPSLPHAIAWVRGDI